MPEIHIWKESECPILVEYSTDAMEQLRQAAVEGLLSLPRVGLGVGGLLLGTREGAKVRILDSVPIPCSHALGPAFQLTVEETAAAKDMVRTAGPLAVLGSYYSRPRASGPLGEADTDVFALVPPRPHQIMLRIKPSTVGESTASLCFAGASGALVSTTERPLFSGIETEAEPEDKPETPAIPHETTLPVETVLAKNSGARRKLLVILAAALLVAVALALLLARK